MTHFEKKPYWIRFTKEKLSSDAFSFFIFDKSPEERKSRQLKIEGSYHNNLLDLKSIKGNLAGLRLDFVQRPEKSNLSTNALMGQMQINGNRLVKSLPQSFASKLKTLSIGKGYFLTGQLTVPKDDLKGFLFEGLFGGQDFDLFGFEFKSLSSTLSFGQDFLKIKDLKVSDLSGELSIDQLELEKSQLTVPKIVLKDFKPSLLHRSNQGSIKHKPLIVDHFEISNFRGDLSDLKTIRGDGHFTFQKSLKKQASLLDIPVHLISKLGLDLTMLNPVEGKVMFMFKDEKMILTKLVDVYSHDRHCHFTLAKQPELSYMDFDGNLNIKLKMKQFVLLKITEPYIISVKGSCIDPRYSFMRKKVVVDVPERAAF